MRERLAADAQRVGDVGEIDVGMRLRDDRPALRRGAASAAGVRADSTSSCGAVGGVGAAPRRRLLEDHVRVGAADAERAHAGAPRRAPRGHGVQRVVRRRTASAAKSIAGFGAREVQRWRQRSCSQRQRGLDQAGGAGGDHQVADVALDRADARRSRCRRCGGGRPASGLDLDRIAERRRRAVRLDVARCCARRRRRRRAPAAITRRLPVDARRGEAGLVAAVVVDGRAADHRVDRVAVGDARRTGA